MASLKELKLRLSSIRSTQKITAAMKMVSSAKLHRAQALTGQTLIYANQLDTILKGLLSAEHDLESPLIKQRPVKRVAVVAFSSSTGLCGTFNANVWKALSEMIQNYKAKNIETRLYPIGKKIANELRRTNEPFVPDFISYGERPTYERAVDLAGHLMKAFLEGEVDQVVLLFHHFKSTATQVLTRKSYLPLALENTDDAKKPTAPIQIRFTISFFTKARISKEKIQATIFTRKYFISAIRANKKAPNKAPTVRLKK